MGCILTIYQKNYCKNFRLNKIFIAITFFSKLPFSAVFLFSKNEENRNNKIEKACKTYLISGILMQENQFFSVIL